MRTLVKPVKNIKGFTLVELLISLVILSVLIFGLTRVYQNLSDTYNAEDLKASMQQKARSGMDAMVRELMMMGYGSSTKVLEAQQDYVRFEETKSGKLYRIKYRLNADGRLSRQTWDMSTDPPDQSNSILMEDVVSLAFEYYDKENAPLGNPVIGYTAFDPDWDDSLPNTQSVTTGACQYNRDQIRRVTVTLVVKSDRPIPGLYNSDGSRRVEYRNITLKADISPRNLWETTDSNGSDPPVFGNSSTAEWMLVRDTHECGKLKAKWQRSTSPDLLGYLVKYGTVDGTWTNYKDVAAIGGSTDDPETEILDIQVSKYTDDPANYYVTVQAYDTGYNYSPLMNPSVHGANDADNTDYAVDVQDTTNSIPKPEALTGVVGFSSYSSAANYDPLCPDGAIVLTWTPSPDPNVVGYRIFRSSGPFSSLPPDESLMIARETDEGGSWAGAVTDKGGSSGGSASDPNLTAAWGYTDGRFVDRGILANGSLQELQGCITYYYAICPVTCDTTRIYGDATHTDIYTSAQFVTEPIQPHETDPPAAPGIEAKAGWRRVFLKMTWPTSSPDYVRTEVYFKQGAPTENINDYRLIPDHQTSKTFIDPATGAPFTDQSGKFFNFGTESADMIEFNSETSDQADGAEPLLLADGTYSFVAISYDRCGNTQSASDMATTTADLCGDDPCGAPLWPLGVNPRVWVDKSKTNLDASTWNPNDPDGNTQIDIGLTWNPIDTSSTGRAADFFGYVVSRSNSPTGPFSEGVSGGTWNSYVINTGLNEGVAYTYRVQAADCVWKNMVNDGTLVECKDGSTWTYDDVRGTLLDGTDGRNITQVFDTADRPADTPNMIIPNIRPGKLRQYTDLNDATNTYLERAYTSGQFHSFVVFYIQNTSLAPLEIEKMAFDWTNPSVYLDSITINEPGYTSQIYPAGAGVKQYVDINRVINNVATGSVSASSPIQVVLSFKNTGSGVIDELSDMRGDVIKWEMQFKNLSMPSSETSDPVAGPFVGGFTTGYINNMTDPADPTIITKYANPRMFKVAAGPSINLVIQDQPDNPTDSVEVVENNLDDPSLPTLPEVDGRVTVNVTVNVTSALDDAINAVGLKVYETDPAATDVTPSTTYWSMLSPIPGTNEWRGTIPVWWRPAIEDKGVWFYAYAISLGGAVGNRYPIRYDHYFYYKQLPFDVCTVNPSPPDGMTAAVDWASDSVTLTWNAPTTYTSGISVDPADTMTYDLYRKPIGGTYALVMSGITGNTYTVSPIGLTTYAYAVKAVNSCTTDVRASGYSNEAIVCSGMDCLAQTTPSVVVDTDWTAGSMTATPRTANLAVFICERANDHSWWTVGPGFGASMFDHIDHSASSMSDITMRVTTLDSTDYTDITLYEINDSGVFTMTGTSDSRIFIDPTYDSYQNGWSNTSPVTTNKLQRTFGATNRDNPEDTITFENLGISGCASFSSTIDVTTDPCANTPIGTTIKSGSRSASNFVTITVDKVTLNTDGSPAVSVTDDVNYRVWYTNTAAAPRLLNSTATDNGNGTVTLKGDMLLGPGENNDPFDFYVTVTDSCPSANESVQSNKVTINKNSTY